MKIPRRISSAEEHRLIRMTLLLAFAELDARAFQGRPNFYIFEDRNWRHYTSDQLPLIRQHTFLCEGEPSFSEERVRTRIREAWQQIAPEYAPLDFWGRYNPIFPCQQFYRPLDKEERFYLEASYHELANVWASP